MAQTQTIDRRNQHRSEKHGLNAMTAGRTGWEVLHLTAAKFEQHMAQHGKRTLGAIAFGGRTGSVASPAAVPCISVEMAVAGDERFFEVIGGSSPVIQLQEADIVGAHDDAVLFACLALTQEHSLEADTCAAYRRLFDFIERAGFPHLLRAWNYIPHINLDEEGLERYRRFSVGRHDAFVAQGRSLGEHVPAACALGTRGDRVLIYFLAARTPGTPIENPRQISAYDYPEQYGPRSPTFSRAMLATQAGSSTLFISGTASIVGHQTVHCGDLSAQADETIVNLKSVMAEASRAQPAAAVAQTRLMFKAYLRNLDDAPLIKNKLAHEFGTDIEVVCLEADICRTDLLLEIEGIYTTYFEEHS